MRYGSVCSGIEAATVAWHDLGWTPAWFSEIEPFPCAVLKHHYPTVQNHGDMSKFEVWPDEPIDLLVGGTPCQSFSVAGLRKGLDDPRGNLMLTFGAIAQRFRPEWLVWENVPGVLSSNGGRDFGTFLGMLAELGYGFAYRVLDAQYFGVAQRRRRVFVVANARSWQRAAAVLFERHSLQGHPAPSRTPGKGIAAGVEGRTRGGGIYDPVDTIAQPVAFHHNAQACQLPTKSRNTSISDPLTTSQGAAVALAFKVRGGVEVDSGGKAAGKGYLGSEETAFTLAATQDQWLAAPQPVAFTDIGQGQRIRPADVPSETLRATKRGPYSDYYQTAMQVRRLTPIECERLQGFPDNYTNIPWRKKDEAPDGPRYKALGNSMAVPVMQWIGERIEVVHNINLTERAQ